MSNELRQFVARRLIEMRPLFNTEGQVTIDRLAKEMRSEHGESISLKFLSEEESPASSENTEGFARSEDAPMKLEFSFCREGWMKIFRVLDGRSETESQIISAAIKHTLKIRAPIQGGFGVIAPEDQAAFAVEGNPPDPVGDCEKTVEEELAKDAAKE